jgi:ribosome-binding factor A
VSGRHVERLADQIRRVLAEILQAELRDPRVGFVTLTGVDLSPDARVARAYVTVLDSSRREDTVRALNHAVPFLRRELAARVALRFTPQLSFVPDAAEEAGQRVDQILDRLRDEHDTSDDPAAG